jgi:hypothetical protein
MEKWRHRHETWKHGHRDKVKQKTEAYATFLNPLPFAHRGNKNLSFVRLITKKQTELSVCKRTKQTCPYMTICKSLIL